MALSDHDEAVLSEMEVGLQADPTLSTTPGRSVSRRPRHHLAAAIGLMAIGVGVTAAGLRLEDNLGTGLGVLGFLLIVYSSWTLVRSPLAGRGWIRAAAARGRTALRDADARRPSRPSEEGS